MPFTEAQPINIHDLVIEQNHAPHQQGFDYKRDLKSETISKFELVDGMEVYKKILNPSLQINEQNFGQLMKNHLYEELGGIRLTDALRTAAEMRILGYEHGLDSSYRELLGNGWGSYEFVQHSQILLAGIESNDFIDKAAMETNKAKGLINPLNRQDELVAIKIIDPSFRLNDNAWGILKERIQYLEYAQDIAQLLLLAAELTILNADEIIIGRSGIELIHPNNPIIFNATPSVPVVRNF